MQACEWNWKVGGWGPGRERVVEMGSGCREGRWGGELETGEPGQITRSLGHRVGSSGSALRDLAGGSPLPPPPRGRCKGTFTERCNAEAWRGGGAHRLVGAPAAQPTHPLWHRTRSPSSRGPGHSCLHCQRSLPGCGDALWIMENGQLMEACLRDSAESMGVLLLNSGTG